MSTKSIILNRKSIISTPNSSFLIKNRTCPAGIGAARATAAHGTRTSPPAPAALQDLSFLMQNSLFLIHNSVFLIQSSVILMQNSSFLLTKVCVRFVAFVRDLVPTCVRASQNQFLERSKNGRETAGKRSKVAPSSVWPVSAEGSWWCVDTECNLSLPHSGPAVCGSSSLGAWSSLCPKRTP